MAEEEIIMRRWLPYNPPTPETLTEIYAGVDWATERSSVELVREAFGTIEVPASVGHIIESFSAIVADPRFHVEPAKMAAGMARVVHVLKPPAKRFRYRYASRIMGAERWFTPAFLCDNGAAIGESAAFFTRKLGCAIACVKDEDWKLLPLGKTHYRAWAREQHRVRLAREALLASVEWVTAILNARQK